MTKHVGIDRILTRSSGTPSRPEACYSRRNRRTNELCYYAAGPGVVLCHTSGFMIPSSHPCRYPPTRSRKPIAKNWFEKQLRVVVDAGVWHLPAGRGKRRAAAYNARL